MEGYPNGDLLDAFENAFPDTGFVIDGGGTIVRTFAGPEIEVLVVDSLENTVGRCLEDVFSSRTATQIEDQIAETLEGGQLQTREYVIDTEIGAHSFEARTAPVATETEDRLVVAIFRDVTTRDLYAQRLDETNRILRAVQRSTKAIGRATDVPELESAICSTITDATPYQFAWIGEYDADSDEIVPRTLPEEGADYVSGLDLAVDGEDEASAAPPVEAVRRDEPYVVQNVHNVATPPTWRTHALEEGFHAVGAFPVGDGDEDAPGRVLAVYAQRPYAFGFSERALFEELARDVAFATDLIEAREEVERQRVALEAHNAEWEILNRIVRHDIRSKMTVVLGRASLLSDSVSGEDEDHLRQLIKSGEQVVDITTEARGVAEALVGTEELDLDDVDLRSVLEGEITEITDIYPDATVTVDGELPSETVRANEFLSSLFRNVLSNAVVHSERGAPHIEVSARTTDETVVVDVADDGPGIPAAIREAVHDNDVDLAESTGHGIGFYLVRALVDQYDGGIEITDNEPRGSVVSIELQRA